MVKFLIHRTTAVTMTLIVLLLLGLLATYRLPVSLMPDIDIPVITIQLEGNNFSARELEGVAVIPLRRQLMQVTHLRDIRCETRDEQAIVGLSFDYGTDIDFAFIEVNEKIDQAFKAFPREIDRPRAVKASASDIPVYYINLTLRDTLSGTSSLLDTSRSSNFIGSTEFVELSAFVNNVVRKRIEQLPEVAMADVSGLQFSELIIVPNLDKMQPLQITIEDLGRIVKGANLSFGDVLVSDGQYQYSVRLGTLLKSVKDIESVQFAVHGRIFQVKELADVIERPQKGKGVVTYNGRRAITIAIIKQSDAQMADLKTALSAVVDGLNKDYPNIDVSITRDQTKLLDFSISNLTQNIIWGGIMAFGIMFLFFENVRSPFLIGISMPASILMSLFLFYLFDLSINIISLSGLLLGLGMMIDNSIIVIDNISQYQSRGATVTQSCIDGTNSVAGPMLSSMLTSCAVFVPLVFLGGISGALFYDQALAVSIGHFSSFLVAVTIVPVYYRVLHRKGPAKPVQLLTRLKIVNYDKVYKRTFLWVFRNQKTVGTIVLFTLMFSSIIYFYLPKSQLPDLTNDEIVLTVDWNQRISLEENASRVGNLLSTIEGYLVESTCLIGEQQFLLDRKFSLDSDEALVYMKVKNSSELILLQKELTRSIQSKYAQTTFSFHEADNLFNYIIQSSEDLLVARLVPRHDAGGEKDKAFTDVLERLRGVVPLKSATDVSLQESVILRADAFKLLIYEIPFEALYSKLATALNENELFQIKEGMEFVPVMLGGSEKTVAEILSQTTISNVNGDSYQLSTLVSLEQTYDFKKIISGKDGEYYPISLDATDNEVENIIKSTATAVNGNPYFNIKFVGGYFQNKKLAKDLFVVLAISLALLYFILVCQFNSFFLPLIVLLEVPIDIFGSLLLLYIFGSGINLMSLIGIVVMSGVIINDSILKLDTANKLINEGNGLMKALLLTGERRLKPIVMTTLSTTVAIVPLFFSSGLGSDLQKPLALALCGGMVVGTLVSLYVIPVCYYYFKKSFLNRY